MAEQIDIMEIKRDEDFTQVGGQAADAISRSSVYPIRRGRACRERSRADS